MQSNPNVYTIQDHTLAAGWERWFLVLADVHWDNPHCRRDIFKRHLDQAKERNAQIFVFGDFFCAMQGKYDPRASKADLRAEHQVNNYLDALVDTAAEYLKPYRENIALLCPGNHETSVLKRQESNLTQRLGKALDASVGGYSGFVRFLMSRGESGRTSRSMYYHHGHGGGGPVTKGTIQSARRAAMLGDCDYVVSGHIHEQWLMNIPQLRLTTSGNIETVNQYHVCTATYKDEFTLDGGFHVEGGRPPKPLGGWWLRMFWDAGRRDKLNQQWIMAE